MTALVILFLTITPVCLALVWPLVLIDFSLLTGAAPLDFGKDGQVAAGLDRMDIHAFRLLGVLVAASLLVVVNVQQTTQYLVRFKFHALFLLFALGTLWWAPSVMYGLRMMAKLAAPFVFLLLVLIVVSTREQLHHIARVMLAAGALTVLVEVISWLLGYRFPGKTGLGIPGLGPAPSSGHLAILSMLAFSAYVHSRSRGYLLLTVCLAGGAAAGFTRITIAGVVAGFALIMFVSSHGLPKLLLPLGGITVLPVLFLFNDSLRYRMFKGGNIPSVGAIEHDPSAALDYVHGSGRFEAWQNVLEQFFYTDPLFGAGVGTTQHYLYTHPSLGLNAIHSEYVRILSELGICGLALFVVALCSYAGTLWTQYGRSSDVDVKTYSLASLGMILVYVLFMATDNAIDYVTSSGIFVFGMIGLAIRAHALSEVPVEPVPVADDQVVLNPYPALVIAQPPRRYPIIEMEQS